MIDYETYRAGTNNNVLVIVVSGRLDNDGSKFFFDCVESHIEDGNINIVLDCDSVDYISSMGLGTLVRAHSRMQKRGGNVRLARVHSVVADALSVVGLDRLLHMYPSVEAACESF